VKLRCLETFTEVSGQSLPAKQNSLAARVDIDPTPLSISDAVEPMETELYGRSGKFVASLQRSWSGNFTIHLNNL
jgi:hypothetical protein